MFNRGKIKMRKILAVGMALCILFCLCACAAAEEEKAPETADKAGDNMVKLVKSIVRGISES